MKIEKYNNDGWGISKIGFEKILETLDNIDFSNFTQFTIIEFGSGISTQFFVDYIQEKELNNVRIISFENDVRFITKAKHSQLEVKLRNLVTCTDNEYIEMFNLKQYNPYRMVALNKEPESRQKNCFYDIQNGDIPETVEFVLLDGPSGNGRNFAFLHLLNKLHSNSIVFIDDYNHYDFIDKFKNLYDGEVIAEHAEERDCFTIFKII